MKYRESCVKVGNLVVLLATESGIGVSGYVDAFSVNASPEATIRVRSSVDTRSLRRYRQLPMSGAEPDMVRDGRWYAFRATDRESLIIHRTGLGHFLEFAPKASCDLVDVWLGRPGVADRDLGTGPVRRVSLVELLPVPVVVFLAGRQGLFLHSCAVTNDGEGILFAGVSGSGKSTMGELWRSYGGPAASVIDDEHIIAHRVDGRMTLHGAPWRRGSRKATAETAPLRAIFFLSHGAENRCVPLSGGESLAQLMSQVFLPVWSKEQVEATVQTSADMVQETQCYHLEFVPDRDVVGFVQDHLGESL